MTLRASIAVDGRAVTLYEQTFEYGDYNSPRTHQRFLDTLQGILPDGCHPIVVTDAGFKNTWFRQVAQKGWFWLGRLRGEVSIKPISSHGNPISGFTLTHRLSLTLLAPFY